MESQLGENGSLPMEWPKKVEKRGYPATEMICPNAESRKLQIPGVSMTLEKWGHCPPQY